MYQELLEALRARFEGVSDKILGRIATRLAKTATTADQVATAVAGVTFQQVLDSYGDSRATEAQQSAVRNYESKWGLKDGVKVNNAGETPAPTDIDAHPAPKPATAAAEGVPSWAQSLLDANKALSERLSQMETQQRAESRRSQLNAIISPLPEALRKGYERTPISTITDEEFAQLSADIKAEVEGIVKERGQRGAVYGRPTAGATPPQDGHLSEAQLAAVKHRGSTPKAGEQPF